MTHAKPTETRGRLGRVLLVDDEAAVRNPLRIHLTQAGYEVVEAADGAAAIRALNDGDNPLMVDAILCDLRMPRLNGMEAITYFRQEYPGVPVVVLTGYPEVERAVALMRQGVRDYLIKPVSREEVLRVVGQAVNQHTLFAE